MPGPPKKPARLKAIAGTIQPCRAEPPPAIELPPLEAAPPPPDWLPNAHALKEWDRLARILTANKLLTEAGVTSLANLCALQGKIIQLYAAGEAPTASLVAQARAYETEFGLTPASQGKVRPAGEGESKNKFRNNGQKAA